MEAEAALYLSLSTSFFRTLVQQGVMPRPRLIGRRRVWDVVEIDVAFEAIPHEDEVEKGSGTWADYE